MRQRFYKLGLLLSITMAVCLTLPSSVRAQSETALTDAEQWVLEQTAAGNVAYLATQFPSEEDRVIRAVFLENLLENPPIKVTRYGVRIQDAVFNDPLDLRYIEVDYDFWLDNSQFNGDVDLSSSHFGSDLSFDGSVFNTGAIFDEMKVDGSVFIDKVIFEGPVSFLYAEMKSLEADEAHFNHAEEEVGFGDLKADILFLDAAVFSGPVDFGYGHFRSFYANDARFLNKEHEVNFFRMKVDEAASLNGAIFSGPVDFRYTQAGSFNANDAQFSNREQEIRFSTMKVDGEAGLNRTVFAGSANFSYSQFGGLGVNDAQFTNPVKEANFYAIKVDGGAFLNKAIFAGPVNFEYAQLGSFIANDAQFSNSAEGVKFSVVKVDGGVFLNRAIFSGPGSFLGSQIGAGFNAQNVQFNDREGAVSFEAIRIEENMDLVQTIFAGPVNFQSAQVQGNFIANAAQFNSINYGVNFIRMKIEGDLMLEKAVFAGPTNFNYSEVLSNFQASDVKFKNAKYQADLRGINVRGVTNLNQAVFTGGVYFDGAAFLDLMLSGARKAQVIPILSFNQTIINRELLLESIRTQNISARSLRVYGASFIQNTTISTYADFENSNFAELTLQNINWPTDSKNVLLGGMMYQHLRMIRDENQDAWGELLGLVNRSNYNAQTYKTLENYFLQQGYPERADDVYIAYKRRERQTALHWNSSAWWWNLFLDGFVLYGRSPARAIIWSFMFILLGVFVFRKPDDMVYSSKEEMIGPKVGTRGTRSRRIPMRRARSAVHEISYNPIWYSLDLFVPFIDLGFDDKWFPKPDRKWAVAYSKIHMLAGWILIPIGLLTITGIIK